MFGKKKKAQKKILESPRGGHYIFAHQAIRQICQPDPEKFFGYMASDEQLAYLQFMLDQVANLNPEQVPDFSAEEIEVTLSRIGNHPLLVFGMPQPKAYTECVYVALVSLLARHARCVSGTACGAPLSATTYGVPHLYPSASRGFRVAAPANGAQPIPPGADPSGVHAVELSRAGFAGP